MTRIIVTKCHGTGNDFVLLDRRSGGDLPYAELAETICDRHMCVGADGVLVLEQPTESEADVRLRIFNADGSEAEMCGNGVRCVARYMHERTPSAPRRLAVQAGTAIVRTEIVDDSPFSVRVEMGEPGEIKIFGRNRVASVSGDRVDVSMGNPHCVLFVEDDLMPIALVHVADAISGDGTYENGVNVEVARAFKDGPVAMRVCERGVGETQACGSGACAVAVAAIETERATSPVRVTMLGGDLTIDWAGPGEPVYMTGGAELVFDATIEVDVDVAAASL